ncbi:SLC13 family permease [Robiginitalea sp. M366]|uniref:SLC13 family permease n=1 Tax=Robiginitalea aestuariiviva TaxID=3036903 RepID=UPI00240E1A1E|nr:SLC13 family permease [Robiginitalea aestuariiviva]MDG1570872.1 SLC13 family permease [Robiginitalea aestuariiviva]
MSVLILILGLTVLLFLWGKWPPDVVALMAMMALYFSGILTLGETLSGFSNPTVIMIAALFIIGEGLARTGWTALAGKKFVALARRSATRLTVILSAGSSLLSGLVSNTGTVAALLPVAVAAAWSAGTFPSKVLMPLAFGSNTGGLLTLTGTPPNIIVSNALETSGQEGFGFFEFGLIGLPLLLISLLYFRFVGFRLLPGNRTANRPASIDTEMHGWIERFSIAENVYRLRIRSMSPMISTRLGAWSLEVQYGVQVLRLRRRHPRLLESGAGFVEFPDPDTELRYHDVLTVKGDPASVDRLMQETKLGLLPQPFNTEELRSEFITQEVGMAQMLITPNSSFVGQRVAMGAYLKKYGIQLLGASRNNKPLPGAEVDIRAGDAFVIRGSWENMEQLKSVYRNLVITGSPDAMARDVEQLTPRSWMALGSLVLLVVLLVLNIVPGAIAALLSAGLVMLTGCVPISQAYRRISWTSVIMIAAMIPMGLALQKTGLASDAANALVASLGQTHPTLLLAGIFLLTTGFSQTINNSATAVLMAPIALMAAASLGLSPQPFLIAVAVSASTAFLTPVGTTTNAMVMSAGGYRFTDYLRVGFPLLLLFFTATLILVPWIWPYR